MPKGILRRWEEHLNELPNRRSVVEVKSIDMILQNAPIECLDNSPSVKESIKPVSKLQQWQNTETGINSQNVELFTFVEYLLLEILTAVIQNMIF